MKKSLLFSCLIVACSSVQAAPISLEYQGFYQRLKQVNKGHYPLVELAFFVPGKDKCHIESGTISTEKESFPLTITKDQRLFLPFDDKLKSDRALINLNIKGQAENCNISMQVRAKQTKLNYAQSELLEIQAQMDALLDEMQGFPMRHFSSDIAGINFVFEPDSKVSVKIDGVEQLVTGSLQLSREQISQLKALELASKPKVISPRTL
ncbi:DUF2987 domain-containing protein [Shewanella woodyi]|uniref:DUF2987 domain-containing protein n=1 Tax=Shewanella woodyi (strain ATCC 51908 / MS32) TaxID=392500 RepID=B1KFY5_SHEWM|nr:DUF2987 domain-containing protein [Shewanella woodyi]ACA86692.1 conserved hypothetical protein [Shewanella woodyi ATCC 51908]